MQEIIEFDDLYWAFLCCDKNKKNTDAAMRFSPFHARQIHKLIDEIYNRKYRLSPYRAFIVEYPTLREVFCAAYRDRVVTWFVVNELGPVIEKNLIYDNANCRKGKGTDFAIRRVQHFIRSESDNYKTDVYALKIDLAGFFMSIDRKILLQALFDVIDNKYKGKYPDTLKYLCEILIMTDVTKNCLFCCDKSKWKHLPKRKTLFDNPNGLPIGSLSSQIFSNLYLSYLDHYIKHDLRVKNYSRYVDDLVIIHKDKTVLHDYFKKITKKLPSLNLIPSYGKCSIKNCKEGVSYLGKIIYPYYIKTQKRYRRKIASDAKSFENPRKAYESLASRKGTLMRYHGYRLGRDVYNMLPENFKKHITYSNKTFFIWNNKTMTLDEILKNNPSFTSLDYAKTVFIWSYSFHSMPILNEKNYRKYFKTECGIVNALDFHIKLIREGYFRKLTKTEVLGFLSYSSLKALAEKLDLCCEKKNKNEIIMAIIEKADKTFLDNLILPDYYTVTTKGRMFVEKHSAMIEVHKKAKQK